MAFQDYYAILGISRSATNAQVRKAYRKLALRYHPDRNPGDPTAEEQFKRITQIYETIADPKTRAEYDRRRSAFENGATERKEERPYPPKATRRQPHRQPRAQSRTTRRPFNPLAFEQTLEENALDLRDLRRGAGAGVVAAAFYSLFSDPNAGALVFIVALFFPWGGERVGFYLGSQFARLLRFEFVESASGLKIPFGMGLLFPIVGGWVGASAWGFGCSFFQVSIPPGQLLIGAVAAGLASPIGAAFGRAFTSVAERMSAKLFGALVGVLIGLVVGSVIGGFLSLFRMGTFGDESFSQVFFSAIVGGALGAVVGSGLGSFREPVPRSKPKRTSSRKTYQI